MTEAIHCYFCHEPIEPGRESTIIVDALDELDDDERLDDLDFQPGTSLRLCPECHDSLEENRRERAEEEEDAARDRKMFFYVFIGGVIATFVAIFLFIRLAKP